MVEETLFLKRNYESFPKCGCGFPKDQVVDYAGRIALFLQMSFEAGH